jgi:hypothetical protein
MPEMQISAMPCPHCEAGHMLPCQDGAECSECFYFESGTEAISVRVHCDKPLMWGV